MTYVALDTMLDTMLDTPAEPSHSLFRIQRFLLHCQSSMSTLYPFSFNLSALISILANMFLWSYSSGLVFTIMVVDDSKKKTSTFSVGLNQGHGPRHLLEAFRESKTWLLTGLGTRQAGHRSHCPCQ